MEHKEAGGGGDFGIPLRPPICLAKLESVKDDLQREAVLESLRVEAREVQSRSKEQLVQFRTEVDIFLRLMYKNKNQHRHSLYYRRLSQVKRVLGFLDYSALEKAVEGFTRWTFPVKQSRANMDQSNLDNDQVSSTFCILISATRILNQIDRPILAASTQVLGLLSQSFFMPLGLSIFSTLARLRVLSQQLLLEMATVYNVLSVFTKQSTEFPSSKTHVLVGASRPRPRLPLHLECHWDGGKLCITETEPPPEVCENRAEVVATVPLTTPLSSGLWFVDDRKSSGVSKKIISGVPITGSKSSRSRDLWLANETTGVKYDVSVSVVMAMEEPPEIPVSTGNPVSADDTTGVKYDVSVSGVMATEELPEIRLSTGNRTSSLLNGSAGVAAISEALKDESATEGFGFWEINRG